MGATLTQPSAALRPRAETSLLSGAMLLLCLGHMTTDLFSSAIPTLQPILTQTYSLSLAQAGWLGGMFMFSSSVLQLPFGILSDRVNSRLFTIYGPLTAAIFLSMLGWASGYPMLLLLTFVGGMGVAAFHPQSTAEASRLSGARRGVGVALFISAGTLGLAFGPPYFSLIVSSLGLEGLAVAMLPAVVICAYLLWQLPDPTPHEKRNTGVDWAVLRAHWKPLATHYAFVVVRSVIQLGIGQFLTLYLVRERGFSMGEASVALALYFLAAPLGSFSGGALADRIGGKQVVVSSMIVAAPFLMGFILTDGWVSLASLFLGATALMLTIPVNVVMAQELAPSQAGTVTSLMMGFGWGVAGITFIPLLGWIADRTGLETVLWGVTFLPAVGLVLALMLPKPKRRAA